MNNQEIGSRIRALRLTLGLTQEEVAEKVGIQQESYRKFETGETHIINRHLEDIANALDTDIPELLMCYDFEQERKVLKDEFDTRYDMTLQEHKRLCGKYEQTIRDKDKIISLMQEIIDSLRKELEELKKK